MAKERVGATNALLVPVTRTLQAQYPESLRSGFGWRRVKGWWRWYGVLYGMRGAGNGSVLQSMRDTRKRSSSRAVGASSGPPAAGDAADDPSGARSRACSGWPPQNEPIGL